MARIRFSINLTDEERQQLNKILEEQKESKRTLLRAQILLMSDEAYEPRLSVLDLAKELNTTHTTVQTTRNEYAEGGLDKAVYRKERVVSRKTRKLNDEVIAQIKELAASDPPEGYKKWTIRLLCKFCEDKGIVDGIAPSSMLRILKEDEPERITDPEED